MLSEQRTQDCSAMERPRLYFALSMMAAVILTAAVFLGGQGEGHVWAGSAEPVPGLVIQEQQVLTSTLYLPFVMGGFDPACPGCPPLFGVDLGAITEANGLPEVVAAGMRWVRRASLRWDRVQPTGPDVYDWSAISGIEAELINARSAGLEPIVVIHGTPSWAQKVPGYSCGPIKEDCLDDFATFVSEVVQRYKGSPYNVRFWELWNEPDAMLVEEDMPPASGYGCWGDPSDLSYLGGGYYAEMLKRAYPAVKAADAEAQVLIGGLLYGKFGSVRSYETWRFLRGVLAAGGGDYFDIVSYHAYSPGWDTWPSDPENILEGKTAHIRQVLAEYGHADKPMMCTEAGYRTFHDDSKLEAQADYVVTDHVRAFSLGLKAHIWYGFYRNDFSGSALLDPETRSPKPAYYAYQAMTQQLDGLYYQGRVEAESNVEEHKFGDGVRTVWVIWTADGDEYDVHFPTAWSPSGQFWVRDKYGQGDIWSDATDGNVDGQVTVQVSESPSYVEPVQ